MELTFGELPLNAPLKSKYTDAYWMVYDKTAEKVFVKPCMADGSERFSPNSWSVHLVKESAECFE